MNNSTLVFGAVAMGMLCATIEATPLALDTSSLTNAWNEVQISSYKCRSAFRDFGKAVADANAEAVTQRTKLNTTARTYLKSQMEKAQAEGNLDRVLVFKNALKSARGGEIAGDDEVVVKLRESYGKQLVLADKALLAAGLTAARAFTGVLEWQKTEATKKGDTETALKIVTLQKRVEEWAKSMQTQAAQTVAAQSTAEQTVAAQTTAVQPVAGSAVGSSSRPPVEVRESSNAENKGKTAAIASSTATSRMSNLTLSGTQKELTVTLAKTQTPHVVRDQYVVPNGSELVAEPGATIVFEKGANIYAEGVLKFEGSEKAPVILKGKASGIGYWHGVIIKQSSETSFEWVQISGATEGLRVIGGTPTIASSVFRENEIGAHIAEDGPHPSFLNCVFTKNRRYGIECHHGSMSLDRCSIVDNSEFGAHIGYSGEVTASSCLVNGNKEGGLRFRDGGHGSFQNSSITGNKKIDVEAHSKCDFRGNWWGVSATRILQQKGDGANLPNIKDGRDEGNGDIVDISDFLTESPKDCGATVKW